MKKIYGALLLGGFTCALLYCAKNQESVLTKIENLKTKAEEFQKKYEGTPITVTAERIEQVNEKRLEVNQNMYDQLTQWLDDAKELQEQAQTSEEKKAAENLVNYLSKYSSFFDLQIKSIKSANEEIAKIRTQEIAELEAEAKKSPGKVEVIDQEQKSQPQSCAAKNVEID